MKIGIIGCGNIGRTLARFWVKAGHEVILSSRHLDNLKPFAKQLGNKASIGTPEKAAEEGEVVLLSIPLIEVPKLSKKVRDALQGKIVMDTCNPYIERDGKAAEEALNDPAGSGTWVAKHLPGARVVKAFNTVYYLLLASEAYRESDPIGIPLASDDKLALQVVSKLIKEAGFGPLIVGDLKEAKKFDHGTLPYGSGASLGQLEKMLKVKRKAA